MAGVEVVSWGVVLEYKVGGCVGVISYGNELRTNWPCKLGVKAGVKQ